MVQLNDDSKSVLLTILNKNYRVNCPAAERSSLLESARYLDERMYRAQRRGIKLDREQVAVMVALNIAHELLKKNAAGNGEGDNSAGGGDALRNDSLARLEDKLDRALDAEKD